jgi:2-haloacid dehalogenase
MAYGATGCTVFDWHSGMTVALARIGGDYGVEADWPSITKEWRRTSTDTVKEGLPTDGSCATIEIDGILLLTLDRMLEGQALTGLPEEGREGLVQTWHEPEVRADIGEALPRLLRRFIDSPFMILNIRLAIDPSRRSTLSWDCAIFCEMIGIYKTLPGFYRTVARWPAFSQDEILLVTTNNSDLKAAHENSFSTAFVYRPSEWGGVPPLDPELDR